MAEIVLTEKNFDSTISGSDVPVLVDFWADWCGPCRMLSPIVSEIAEEYEGKLIVGKVNIDEEPYFAQKFGIVSIPFLMLFKDGEPVGNTVGYMQKQAIVDQLLLDTL